MCKYILIQINIDSTCALVYIYTPIYICVCVGACVCKFYLHIVYIHTQAHIYKGDTPLYEEILFFSKSG